VPRSTGDGSPSRPLITAVIPTSGRPEIHAAIASVRSQTISAHSIVVWDGCPKDESALALKRRYPEDDVTIVATGIRSGGAAARTLGTNLAESEYVGYLDDDDVWFPEKSALQLEYLASNQAVDLVGCRLNSFNTTTKDRVGPIPRSVYANQAPIQDWLFRKRALRSDRNFFQTSTLVMRTSDAKALSWRSTQRHEDWDFLLRAQMSGLMIAQMHEVLVELRVVRSTKSVSAGSAWTSSLAWAESYRDEWSSSTFSDFLVSQPLRYALQARDFSAAVRIVRLAFSSGLPSIRNIVLGGSGILSRSFFEHLLHLSGRRVAK
jgi:glycosyltransferase involved in cell wall biosynthesis